jgi:DNA helicase-2/ATP-dependent DNA helicase PcrA
MTCFEDDRDSSNNDDIREKWASRFDHILVDEFQDTNDVQYKLMKLLLRSDTSIYVVGDPDQTIYTWRGANQNIILNFEKEYPNVETIILNENYRSTKTILDAANKLIANNKKRVPKDLFTNHAIGEKIETNMLPKAEDEAHWVGGKIQALARE